MSKLKMSYIYQAINKINNKSYIGKTINFKSRKSQHINGALKKKHKKVFYSAIRKYGKHNFKWKILFQDYCHPNKLNELEKFFIAYYETQCPNGYNIHIGGLGGDTLTYHPNREEIKIKMSKKASKVANKRNKISANTMNKLDKNGMTIYQKFAIKISNTVRKIDSTTNLSIAQRRAIQAAKTRKLNGTNSMYGHKNACAKKISFNSSQWSKNWCIWHIN